MKLEHLSLIYESKKPLMLLDQTRIPNAEVWVSCNTLNEMVDAIKKLKVRGAPLIGLSANFFLASLATKGLDLNYLLEASKELEASRPTAVNLIRYMKTFREFLVRFGNTDWIENWATEQWETDRQASDKMAAFGTTLIKPGFKVLTHCNTGGLAAAGNGTAFGVINKAFELYGDVSVYVDETRPLLQGGRLTTWELSKKKIPYKLISDNMAASLMNIKEVDAVFVGADRIASNGDTANKIGTYGLSVLCHYHGIPFYIVAPEKTIDPELESGAGIPIEQRNKDEVRGWKENLWAPDCEAYNPAFDVTPANLISAWITEKGIFKNSDIENGAFKKH